MGHFGLFLIKFPSIYQLGIQVDHYNIGSYFFGKLSLYWQSRRSWLWQQLSGKNYLEKIFNDFSYKKY
ncbi:unnamed protein product [Blepharisma stoltei]|uniref:Uncharacterized protein n=1 Tax=Blepharisma stoltei TaxID=1481888 RepID=A0AAU9I9A0_9CILI|nr:unnamed protein product [Blepharisma stoltei]